MHTQCSSSSRGVVPTAERCFWQVDGCSRLTGEALLMREVTRAGTPSLSGTAAGRVCYHHLLKSLTWLFSELINQDQSEKLTQHAELLSTFAQKTSLGQKTARQTKRWLRSLFFFFFFMTQSKHIWSYCMWKQKKNTAHLQRKEISTNH